MHQRGGILCSVSYQKPVFRKPSSKEIVFFFMLKFHKWTKVMNVLNGCCFHSNFANLVEIHCIVGSN